MPIRTSKDEAVSMEPPAEISKPSTGDTKGDRTQGQESFEMRQGSQSARA